MAVIVGKTGMSAEGREDAELISLKVSMQILRTLESHLLTKFDRKARGELHLNKLPEFIKVLEGCNHLQDVQQPEK